MPPAWRGHAWPLRTTASCPGSGCSPKPEQGVSGHTEAGTSRVGARQGSCGGETQGGAGLGFRDAGRGGSSMAARAGGRVGGGGQLLPNAPGSRHVSVTEACGAWGQACGVQPACRAGVAAPRRQLRPRGSSAFSFCPSKSVHLSPCPPSMSLSLCLCRTEQPGSCSVPRECSEPCPQTTALCRLQL